MRVVALRLVFAGHSNLSPTHHYSYPSMRGGASTEPT